MRLSIQGFSIVELMVVIAMISIVSSAFLYTDLQSFFQKWQVRQVIEDDVSGLMKLIEQARSLSVLSGKEVMLCGGLDCNGDWSQLAYYKFSSSAQPIDRYFFHELTQVRWRGFPAQRRFIIFLPTGLSSYQNGSFYLCQPDGDAKRILMNQSGRAYADSEAYEVSICQ